MWFNSPDITPDTHIHQSEKKYLTMNFDRKIHRLDPCMHLCHIYSNLSFFWIHISLNTCFFLHYYIFQLLRCIWPTVLWREYCQLPSSLPTQPTSLKMQSSLNRNYLYCIWILWCNSRNMFCRITSVDRSYRLVYPVDERKTYLRLS